MSNIVPFDGNTAYVVRSLSPEKREGDFHIDSMGRTEQDRKFLDQFEKLFYAAASGNISKCRQIVEKGFCDFNAYSVGRFSTPSGRPVDYTSPLQIAEAMEYHHITKYFQKKLETRQSTCQQVLLAKIMSEGVLKAAESPVTADHLKRALCKKYDPEIIELMLNQALQNEDLDTTECIDELFQGEYPDELIAQFVTHAHTLLLKNFGDALELKYYKTAEAFLDKASEVPGCIWGKIFPAKNSIFDAFDRAKAKFTETTGHQCLTDEFLDSYYASFKDKPKPYLPHLTPLPRALILKLIQKCPELSRQFGLGDVLGQLEEDLIGFLLGDNIDVIPFQFEHVLLYGYSEKLVLHLCRQVKPGELLDRDILQIAVLRGYSPIAILELKDKCPPPPIIYV
jgi:hypothetical protein